MTNPDSFVVFVDPDEEAALAKQAEQVEYYSSLADDPESPEAAAEGYLKAQRDEYSAYVAISLIYIDGALAFTPGSQVPKSHVSRFNLEAEGYVAPASSVESD